MPITVTVTITDPTEDQMLLVQKFSETSSNSKPPKAADPKPKAAPKPEPEPEDVLGTDEPTLEDAVARATALVADGKTARVKDALSEAGAKRVSELSGAKIKTFLDALDG